MPASTVSARPVYLGSLTPFDVGLALYLAQQGRTTAKSSAQQGRIRLRLLVV